MQLIGVDALNVATLDYDRIVHILVEREDQPRRLHFQLVGHDVEEENARRELRRVRSRLDPPRALGGSAGAAGRGGDDADAAGNPDNLYDSESDWEESTSIIHARVSPGPIHAVLAAGENGYGARVVTLQQLDMGAKSELQLAGVAAGMIMVGINNIRASRLKFPEIVVLLQVRACVRACVRVCARARA